MSDVSSDLGGIRAGPVERDIEQVRAANPSLGGSISPPPVPGSTAGATEMWMGRSSSIAYRLRALLLRVADRFPLPPSLVLLRMQLWYGWTDHRLSPTCSPPTWRGTSGQLALFVRRREMVPDSGGIHGRCCCSLLFSSSSVLQ